MPAKATYYSGNNIYPLTHLRPSIATSNDAAATAEIEGDFGDSTQHQSRYASYMGVFQMGKLAYLDALKEIKRHDPELYDSLIQDSIKGRRDPANDAVAAIGYFIYLYEGLEQRGVHRPAFHSFSGESQSKR